VQDLIDEDLGVLNLLEFGTASLVGLFSLLLALLALLA